MAHGKGDAHCWTPASRPGASATGYLCYPGPRGPRQQQPHAHTLAASPRRLAQNKIENDTRSLLAWGGSRQAEPPWLQLPAAGLARGRAEVEGRGRFQAGHRPEWSQGDDKTPQPRERSEGWMRIMLFSAPVRLFKFLWSSRITHSSIVILKMTSTYLPLLLIGVYIFINLVYVASHLSMPAWIGCMKCLCYLVLALFGSLGCV